MVPVDGNNSGAHSLPFEVHSPLPPASPLSRAEGQAQQAIPWPKTFRFDAIYSFPSLRFCFE